MLPMPSQQRSELGHRVANETSARRRALLKSHIASERLAFALDPRSSDPLDLDEAVRLVPRALEDILVAHLDLTRPG